MKRHMNTVDGAVLSIQPHQLLCLFCALEQPAGVPDSGAITTLSLYAR